MGYIHAACLKAWVQEKGSLTCELCKQQYQEQFVLLLGLAAAADEAELKKTPAVSSAESSGRWGWRFWALL
jgi:hypothetical protein